MERECLLCRWISATGVFPGDRVLTEICQATQVEPPTAKRGSIGPLLIAVTDGARQLAGSYARA